MGDDWSPQRCRCARAIWSSKRRRRRRRPTPGPSTTRLDLDVPQQPIGGQPSRSIMLYTTLTWVMALWVASGVLGSVSNLARARCVAARQEGGSEKGYTLWDASSTSTPRSSQRQRFFTFFL
jgi:hypothetical protein